MAPALERLSTQRLSRLYILDFGLFKVHDGPRIIGIPGYLLTTDGGMTILIDTGFPADYAADGAAAAARDGLGRFGDLLNHGPEKLLVGQLAHLGLTPADIDLTILTHSHIDHVGQLDLVRHAPVVMARAERILPRPLYFGGACPFDWPDMPYHLIDSDTELCRGVRLLMTPGHSQGHVSLVLDLPQTGPVVLTADAISRPAEVTDGFADAWNPPKAIASAERLLTLGRDLGALVIYGHAPDQWSQLRKAPAFYA